MSKARTMPAILAIQVHCPGCDAVLENLEVHKPAGPGDKVQCIVEIVELPPEGHRAFLHDVIDGNGIGQQHQGVSPQLAVVTRQQADKKFVSFRLFHDSLSGPVKVWISDNHHRYILNPPHGGGFPT